MEYDIDVTSSYTGTKTPSDLIGAVAMKAFVSSYSNESLILAPGGTGNWEDDVQEELNAGGCDGTAHGGAPEAPRCAAKYAGQAPKPDVVLVF